MKTSSIKNKIFAALRDDHSARFKRWWYFENPASCSSPIARKAAQTVLFPVHKRVPSNRVKAFFQEGLEKSTEKGSKTDKMLRDRESMGFTICALEPNSINREELSIHFF